MSGFVSCVRARTVLRRAVPAGVVAVVSGVALCGSAAALPAGCAGTSGLVTCTFGSTGSEQTFTVPDGVTSVSVVAIGGHGGTSADGTPGGRGAVVRGDLPVTPRETLYVAVGGAGGVGSQCVNNPVNCGGFNGGAGTYGTGGGGGASDVRSSSRVGADSLASRLLVAGGGGGGGTGYQGCAGGAGGDAGARGTDGQSCGYDGGTGGGAGTATAGGTAGTPEAGPGTLGAGGWSENGGGGGGGLYGGGGGGSNAASIGYDPFFGSSGGAGGGGGSNLVPSGGSASLDTAGVPSVTITYNVLTPTTLVAAPAKARWWHITFSAKLTRSSDGVPLSGKTITFTYRGRPACQATTNVSGVASCTIRGPLLLLGKSSYTARFAGDDHDLPSSATGTVS